LLRRSHILIETYFWTSDQRPFVCEICQFHPQLGWETQPGKTISDGKVVYTTNSLGMRSGEVDFSKKHVLLVGDSVTFGLGVNNHETVSHYLTKENNKFQFLNLGVPGYGIGQYYLNLKRHIDQLNPKLVLLIIYTSNDLDETRQDTRYGISKPFFLYQEGNLLYLNPEISKFSCSNIYSRSRFLKNLLPDHLINQCQSRTIERNKASPTIAKLIDSIRVLGMKKNIPTLIVLSPALTAVKRVACKQTNKTEACKNFDPGFEVYYKYFSEMMDLYKLPYVDFLKNLVEYSKKNDVNFLYRNNGEDIHHYSPLGNALLAKTIINHLAINPPEEIFLN
jgi:hypothetical protein